MCTGNSQLEFESVSQKYGSLSFDFCLYEQRLNWLTVCYWCQFVLLIELLEHKSCDDQLAGGNKSSENFVISSLHDDW